MRDANILDEANDDDVWCCVVLYCGFTAQSKTKVVLGRLVTFSVPGQVKTFED